MTYTEMTYTEQDHDNEIAMVHLGTHGSTCYPPQKWHGWAHAETGYAPEWLSSDDLDGADPDDCTTVLDYSLSTPEAPDGWRLVSQYAAGETSCPWCGDGTGDYEIGDVETTEESRRKDCKLCEGDGYIYSGEECQVCVFAPIPNEEYEAEARETDDWLTLLKRCPEAELVRDVDAPLLWSVVTAEEIVGAGNTAKEAIAEADRQLTEWDSCHDRVVNCGPPCNGWREPEPAEIAPSLAYDSQDYAASTRGPETGEGTAADDE